MKNGIKKRLVFSYLLLICLTVVLFEVIIFMTVRYYFHDNIKNSFINQGIIFSNFYSESLMERPLETYAEEMLENYSFLTEAQVQMVDVSGKIVADSHASSFYSGDYPDVQTALLGEASSWTGKWGVLEEPVLAVSYPLRSNGEVVGVIRFISSLVLVQEQLNRILFFLLFIGLIVICIAALISFLLVNTITKPLKVMTEAAHQLASGKFSVRIAKEKDDELGELADTLNYMASEVEKHEQLKNEFIASISHELRTPLTSIKGWGITLHSMSKEPLFKEGMEIITNETERLNELVEDLLDFSSLSTGKMKIIKEKINIVRVVEQVYQQMKPRAERLGIKFLLLNGDSVSLMHADKNRLKQVFINLIDNAFKFTSENGIVTISIKQKQETITITIADTGKGIAPADLHNITSRFYKGDTTKSGIGLGLAICKEIISAHQGQLQIESEEGIGTTVQIDFPL